MAGKLETFEQFLASQQIHIDYSYLILALITAALLSFILAKLYVRFGTSVSNRKQFSANFVLLAAATTLIIMIVRSSLALSLGLFGALSIVRFRAAIKEPEELVFLFLCISIGLGLGANQIKVTTLSFILLALVVISRGIYMKKEENQNLFINISAKSRSVEIK